MTASIYTAIDSLSLFQFVCLAAVAFGLMSFAHIEWEAHRTRKAAERRAAQFDFDHATNKRSRRRL